jgi:hypothetical protein
MFDKNVASSYFYPLFRFNPLWGLDRDNRFFPWVSPTAIIVRPLRGRKCKIKEKGKDKGKVKIDSRLTYPHY